MDPRECVIGRDNTGWVKRECMADAGPDTANCNLLSENFVNGFTSSGFTILSRMGVNYQDFTSTKADGTAVTFTNDYDMAHYFGKRGGGGLGGCCVCASQDDWYGSSKASGGTAVDPPNGDAFNVDFVAHEMGHQFGHGHTFAGTGSNCGDGGGGGNFLADQAVELGAGKTLLSYAGICEDTREYNTPRHSSPYMASVSLGFFSLGQNDPNWSPVGWRNAGGELASCGTVTTTGNNRPTVTVLPTCTIPKGTPYELFGVGSDTDADDVLSYNWEQIDAAVQQVSLSQENMPLPGQGADSGGPLVVSAEPTTGGNLRLVPEMRSALDFRGTTAQDAMNRVSTVAREMHFTLTARDSYNGAGSQCQGAGACSHPSIEADHDGPPGASHIGSWHAAVSTITVADVGPLLWTKPAAPPAVAPPAPTADEIAAAAALEAADTCPYKNDGMCDVPAYCHTGTDLADCAPPPSGRSGSSCADVANVRWQGTKETAQLALALAGCAKADAAASHTTIQAGPLEVEFKLSGGDLAGATYSIEIASGDTAAAAEASAGTASGWSTVAQGLETSRGLAAHTVNVPLGAMGGFVILRAITGATTDRAAPSCRAYALSPTMAVDGSNPPAAVTLSSSMPAPGATVPLTGLVASWTFSAPVYFALGLPAPTVSSAGVDFTSAINGNQLTLTAAGPLPPSTDLVLTVPPGAVVSAPTADASAVAVPSLSFASEAPAQPAPVAPTLSQVAPASGSVVDHAAVPALRGMADASVALGAGTITVTTGGATVCEIGAGAGGVTVEGGNTLNVDTAGLCQFQPGKSYAVDLPAGLIVASSGGVGSGAYAQFWAFSTAATGVTARIDEAATALADPVAESAPVTVYFTEDVVAAAGAPGVTVREVGAATASMRVLPLGGTAPLAVAAPASGGSRSLIVPAAVFDAGTGGYRSLTTYSIDFGASLEDAAGNALALGLVTFTTGDSHAPNVMHVSVEQAVFAEPVVATITLDAPDVVLRGGGGSFFLHETSSGTVVREVAVDGDSTLGLSYVAGVVHVSFDAEGLPEETALSLRWSAGVLKDEHSNGITGWPRLYPPNPNVPDNPDRYTVTTKAAPRAPPPPPTDLPINGDCWNSVVEEQLLHQFVKLADFDAVAGTYSIAVCEVGTDACNAAMQALRAKLADLGTRDYTTAEMHAMLEAEDRDGDGEVTSQEYVTNECPADPEATATAPAPAPAPEPAFSPSGNLIETSDGAAADLCPYANDGECDVPDYCPAASDMADCAELPPPPPPVDCAGTDVVGYEDEYYQTCGSWAGYDCTTATTDWSYSQGGQDDLIANCCATCSTTAADANTAAASDTCPYQDDGECDASPWANYCEEGTDLADCADMPAPDPNADACDYADDGECDARYMGDYCPINSDVNDCAAYPLTCSSGSDESNDWAGDGYCDEEAESCPRGTDTADCEGR
jgi:hypothetical protein